MDETLTNKKHEQEIGKQLVLTRIIDAENRKVARGGFSLLSRDTLADWFEMDRIQLDTFISMHQLLNKEEMELAATSKYYLNCLYRDNSKGLDFMKHAMFIKYTISTYEALLCGIYEKVNVKDFGVSSAKSIYKSYCESYPDYPIDESIATPQEVTNIIRFYLEYFIEAVQQARKCGYDWDVISSMHGGHIDEDILQELIETNRLE